MRFDRKSSSLFRTSLGAGSLIRVVLIAIAILGVSVVAKGQGAGAATFKAMCAMCHGADGAGKTPMGAKLSIANLASPELQKKTDAALIESISKGKNKMPEFGSKLSAAEITQVKNFIRALGKQP